MINNNIEWNNTEKLYRKKKFYIIINNVKLSDIINKNLMEYQRLTEKE